MTRWLVLRDVAGAVVLAACAATLIGTALAVADLLARRPRDLYADVLPPRPAPPPPRPAPPPPRPRPAPNGDCNTGHHTGK